MKRQPVFIIAQTYKIYKEGSGKMKNLGIIRKLDDLGRIVLPIELRKKLIIEEGTSLEIFTDKDKIILRKYESKICKQCKNKIDDNDKFCKYCGNEVNSNE